MIGEAIVTYSGYTIDSEGYDPYRISQILNILATVGLFGFAYKVPLLKNIFWKAFFFVLIIDSIRLAYVGISKITEIDGTIEISEYGILLFGITIIVLILSANFLYSFKSEDIWSKNV